MKVTDASPDNALEMTLAQSPSENIFTTTEGQRDLPALFPRIFDIISRIEVGALEFELPDGRVFRAQGATPGQTGRMIVHRPKMFWRMATGAELGFAESYLDGDWSTPDLQAVLDVAIENNKAVARGLPKSRWIAAFESLQHWLNRNTRRQARKNIEAHYDLGNQFYGKWLDPSMTYSAGLFEEQGESLEDAQRNKYRSICDRMGLRQGDHVLEVGCGWGGFAEYAARERGAKVTGLTISPAQLEFAQRRMQEQGLNERVELVLRDYRDERGQYDGVASIEMFEAVGEKYWPSFFETVHDRLKPGAQASLQIITIADDLFERYRNRVDFIQKYIFPGGMLPSVAALKDQTARSGLEWVDIKRFGEGYSETLRQWRTRFLDVWDEVQALPSDKAAFDERFRRMWEFYLAICAACFRAGTTDVVQLSLKRA